MEDDETDPVDIVPETDDTESISFIERCLRDIINLYLNDQGSVDLDDFRGYYYELSPHETRHAIIEELIPRIWAEEVARRRKPIKSL